MKLGEFIFATRRTWQPACADLLTDRTADIAHAAMGLAGEAGEVLDLIKKQVFTPIRLEQKGVDFYDTFEEEMGDVIYYWARLCDIIGLDPEEVMAATMAKLDKRWKQKEEAA